MADLSIEERVANIERQLLGFSYEEAKPVYDAMKQTINSMEIRPDVRFNYFESNKELLTTLERVLGIKSP